MCNILVIRMQYSRYLCGIISLFVCNFLVIRMQYSRYSCTIVSLFVCNILVIRMQYSRYSCSVNLVMWMGWLQYGKKYDVMLCRENRWFRDLLNMSNKMIITNIYHLLFVVNVIDMWVKWLNQFVLTSSRSHLYIHQVPSSPI